MLPRRKDRTINPHLGLMATRLGSDTVEVKSRDLSLISHPDDFTRLAREAAGHQA